MTEEEYFCIARGKQISVVKLGFAVMGFLLVYLLILMQLLPTLRCSTFLLMVSSIGFLVVNRSGEPDLLNPVRVFGGLWCFCLALASMRLLPTLSEWSPLMWSCVLTGLVTFIVGFWVAKTISDGRNRKLGLSVAEELSVINFLPNGKTLILAGILLLVGASILAYEDFLIGGIPVLSDNPDFLRSQLFGTTGDPKFDTFSLKFLHLFVECLKYGVFLAFIVLFQKKRKSAKTVFFSMLIIFVGTLVYTSQAGRMFAVVIVVTGVVLFHYLRRHIRLVEIGAATVILFLFIGVAGSLRINQSQSAPLFERALRDSSFPEGQFWEGVAFGYATVTVSLEVFYRLTEDLRNMRHPPGGFLFYALHRFIPRTSLGEIAGDLYSGETTTSTFLGDFYGDYGYWGVLFGPLIMGMLYGWAYSLMMGTNAIYWVYVRALLLQMVIFFPYVNMFSLYLTWIFDLVAMYFIVRFLTKKPAPKVLPSPNFPALSH